MSDERLTTQVCPDCGAVSGPKGIADLGVRDWVCVECGVQHDRDINSAINILVSGRNAGLQLTENPPFRAGKAVKPTSPFLFASEVAAHGRWVPDASRPSREG
ncbi:MAG TPA: zinc ribbon domain-containing protein [Steroidobacteraceae bacterium]|nr:zinc ribbon domain-containing protein [Steroidobacteraceae bacterium]